MKKIIFRYAVFLFSFQQGLNTAPFYKNKKIQIASALIIAAIGESFLIKNLVLKIRKTGESFLTLAENFFVSKKTSESWEEEEESDDLEYLEDLDDKKAFKESESASCKRRKALVVGVALITYLTEAFLMSQLLQKKSFNFAPKKANVIALIIAISSLIHLHKIKNPYELTLLEKIKKETKTKINKKNNALEQKAAKFLIISSNKFNSSPTLLEFISSYCCNKEMILTVDKKLFCIKDIQKIKLIEYENINKLKIKLFISNQFIDKTTNKFINKITPMSYCFYYSNFFRAYYPKK